MTIKYRELKRRYELDGPKKTATHLTEALNTSSFGQKTLAFATWPKPWCPTDTNGCDRSIPEIPAV